VSQAFLAVQGMLGYTDSRLSKQYAAQLQAAAEALTAWEAGQAHAAAAATAAAAEAAVAAAAAEGGGAGAPRRRWLAANAVQDGKPPRACLAFPVPPLTALSVRQVTLLAARRGGARQLGDGSCWSRSIRMAAK